MSGGILSSFHNQFKGYANFGFTLAEVLITLVVIGVVAALTVPSLIDNYREKQTVVRLKKVYSILQSAYLRTVNEYGTPDQWPQDLDNPITLMSKYLNVIKNCKTATGCIIDSRTYNPPMRYKNFNVPNFYKSNSYKAQLDDGVQISVSSLNPQCNTL